MRIAALDLGSNSFHLLVADAHPDGSFDRLFREKEMLRLGDVVARHGRLTDEACDHALDAVRRFRSLAEGAGADVFVACATSAIREADNGGDLVERIARDTGVRVRVISGAEEAALIFRAVQASVLIDPGPALCLDLGGGSLEVMVGDSTELAWATSLKLGVARLTAELVKGDPVDPLRPGDQRRLRKRIEAVLGPVADAVAPFQPKLLVGTSGTLCDLARMAVAEETGAVPISVNQHRVSRTAVEKLHETLVGLPLAGRRRIPGLDVRRAELAPAGSLLAVVAMELFGFDELVVGTWALREGMVLAEMLRHTGADLSGDPRVMRAASVLDLCQRCGWREVHSRQVARVATSLFDQTASLHGLGENHRELLEHAAFLHDIGEHVSGESHHKHTAYLIQHGQLRGFSPHEVGMLATIGRYHRQGEPKTSFEPFAAMDDDARAEVRVLTALLQIADGLDRGHAGTVEDVQVTTDDDRIVLLLCATGDVELDLWGARRKRSLFEQVFGRRLELTVPGEAAPDLAAWSTRRGA
ncbi:MAG TPA: Ppx/GppA phosphatase family protein [Acidimicrobiales bacterium]|nr:Ppx/GppA phosphatase family protein [Acidimicrobiales bacterium]